MSLADLSFTGGDGSGGFDFGSLFGGLGFGDPSGPPTPIACGGADTCYDANGNSVDCSDPSAVTCYDACENPIACPGGVGVGSPTIGSGPAVNCYDVNLNPVACGSPTARYCSNAQGIAVQCPTPSPTPGGSGGTPSGGGVPGLGTVATTGLLDQLIKSLFGSGTSPQGSLPALTGARYPTYSAASPYPIYQGGQLVGYSATPVASSISTGLLSSVGSLFGVSSTTVALLLLAGFALYIFEPSGRRRNPAPMRLSNPRKRHARRHRGGRLLTA